MALESVTEIERLVDESLPVSRVPEHLHGGLRRYIVNRIQPGHFMLAVLSNDLREAMGRGDEASRAGLFHLVCWLMNCAPHNCWGSPEKVRSWLSSNTDSGAA